ncbi:MAG: hypothetical protein OEZ01_00675 [Candidatus Heimdallarchaeota archaeon]|nr:hypothetical protein [Candidatus Heimdallarchaeota archaeon]MDH5644486.1 hypothetical protein [Candidatus Heimdallarchaeota archaeon]
MSNKFLYFSILMGFTISLLIIYYGSNLGSELSNLIKIYFVGIIILSITLFVFNGQLYQKLAERDIDTGFVFCPNCSQLQSIDQKECLECLVNYDSCQVCLIPFSKGSSVLIAPCCGLGFHPDHFEGTLREIGVCPSCLSNDVIMEVNW